MLELLAPSGDIKCAYAAINSGADAVYLGLTAFSARASASNFDFSSLKELTAYAHAFGVKVYVAMNTLVKERELAAFSESMIAAYNAGADAVIMQDMLLGKYVKERLPQIKLHLSTQAGVNNVYGAAEARDCGFDRVILARETGLEDIKEITKIIETEVFVQGALCTCFSGQCYLSSFAGGNSGNRGKCKQPCRKLYSIDRSGFEDLAYRLSLSDLCVGESIDKLIEAGVTSFKIEGRMRRPEYVAAAVGYYRNILDGKSDGADKSALKRTYNRGNYTKGLAFGQDKSFISSAVQGHIGEYCGTVKVINGRAVVSGNGDFAAGDCFKILRGGKEVGGAVYGGKCREGFYLDSAKRLKNGDKAFITTDVRLNQRLLSVNRNIKVEINARFTVGERAEVDINGLTVFGDDVLQSAQSRPLTYDDVKKCFDKTDAYPYEVIYGDVRIEGDIFIPSSRLNALRRKVYSRFFKSKNNLKTKIEKSIEFHSANRGSCKKTAVIAQNLNGVKADIGILKCGDLFTDFSASVKNFIGEKFLYLPPYMKGEEIEKIKGRLKDFDGIYCDAYYAAGLARETGKKFFAGTGFNISNSAANSCLTADYVALSKELTSAEAKQIAGDNCFYLTAGGVKVMDLIYCPFEKSCGSCDRRSLYRLTDGEGRVFPLRRYECSGCRFELYNCATLVCENNFTGKLYDFTLDENCAKTSACANAVEKLKKIYKNYTKGHSDRPVL